MKKLCLRHFKKEILALKAYLSSKFATTLPRRLRAHFRHPANKAFGDQYYGPRASNYDLERATQPSWSAEYAIVESFAQAIPQKSTVLDVPMGTGRFLPIYESLGFKITGLDTSEDMLSISRTRGATESSKAVHFVEGDARKMPFEDDSFDLVVCFRFLQSIVNFSDAKLVLAEISRVCRGVALLHLEVSDSPTGLGESDSFPNGHEPIRGQLDWPQTQKLLSDQRLHVIERRMIIPRDGSTSFAVLCSPGVA